MTRALEKAIAEVDRLVNDGDLLRAFDQASAHVERFPDSETLKHKGLLALARAGATDRAAQLFRTWALDTSDNADVLALEGRLAKDQALTLTGGARRDALLKAGGVYGALYARTPNYYLAINWATPTFLAGDRAEAARIAELVLADPAVANAGDYWSLATRAEANLVLGRTDRVYDDLAAAGEAGASAGQRASTRKQLKLILAESGIDAEAASAFLSALAPPATVHYVDPHGARYGWGDRNMVRETKRRLREALAELQPGVVFGSLGSPAEILFAEAALASGIELNVVLPMLQPAFQALYVDAGGERWVSRFRACCRKAARVVCVSEDADADDTGLAEYSARVAMGLALLRAQHVDGEAVQVVLGGDAGGSDAGEGDAAAPSGWGNDETRRRVDVALPRGEALAQGEQAEQRMCSAVIFGDVPGFSKLPDKALPIFWDTVMATIGDVVNKDGEAVADSNTWGDAIHLVVPDVRHAAHVCLSVQRALALVDGRALDRDEPPTMRIGAHYGPVFEGWDPVRGHHTYYGRAMSRAARIEPITPPGLVYVTEAFAAILLLESRGEFTCTYVGQVPLAKGFGTFRMYDLRG